MIRKSLESDVNSILGLCQGKPYDTEIFRNILSDRVVLDRERLLAYGSVKLFAESVLVLSDRESSRQKVEALKSLMAAAVFETKKFGLSELHAFAHEPFASILEKHFDFKRIPQIGLVKDCG